MMALFAGQLFTVLTWQREKVLRALTYMGTNSKLGIEAFNTHILREHNLVQKHSTSTWSKLTCPRVFFFFNFKIVNSYMCSQT